MKVLFVCSLYDPYIGGGAEVTLRYLVEGLASKGVDVVVATVGPRPGLHKELVNGVTVWRAGYRNLYFHHHAQSRPAWQKAAWHALDMYNPLMQTWLRHIVEVEKPDIASCHNLPGWSVAAWRTLQSMQVPVVQVLHDQYLLCSKSTMFDGERICQTQCASCSVLRCLHPRLSAIPVGVVGVSNFILQKFLHAGYFPNAREKHAIHNVRELPALLPQERTAVGSVFGFIGTLAPNKGIERLLTDFMAVAKPEWRLLVAGRGGTAYVADLRARFGDARIEFLGQTEPGCFYPEVDVVVAPSLWEEPLGMVVAEAMMYGCPVIGSRRGGIPEMIDAPRNGLLFDPDDASGLTCALQDAAAMDWRSHRDAIRESVAAFTDIDVWLARWQSLYSRLAKEHAI